MTVLPSSLVNVVSRGNKNEQNVNRTDQNTGGALLELPMRTAMHRKSRVSSAISVCDN